MAGLATVTMLLGVGVASASAAGQSVAFGYTVNSLPAGATLSVTYNTGLSAGASGGFVQARSGAIGGAFLLSNAMLLSASSNGPLTARVTEFLYLGSAPVTGVATIPAGASVTVTNQRTNQTMTLSNGPFSIPSGVGALGARPPAGGNQTVNCRGGARACQARISLAGGASNRKLTIRLTDTDLRLQSVKAYPRSSQGAYSLTGGHFKLGGSEYVVTLNAVQSNPRGSHLILSFRAFG